MWRVGYAPSPWEWTDWKFANTGGRFDGRSGEHRGEFTLQFILPNAAPSTPTPDHGATPPATSPSLPETGGDVIPILPLSLAAMIAGGFLIARRRTARGR